MTVLTGPVLAFFRVALAQYSWQVGLTTSGRVGPYESKTTHRLLTVIHTALIYLGSKKNEGRTSNQMQISIELHWIA